MSYSNIKRILSAALLIAFTAPSTIAVTENSLTAEPVVAPYSTSMNLSGSVNLIENSDTITLSLRDSDVKQVLRMFADKAGMNIVFHESVSGQVTLDLVNTTVNEAFALVLQIAGLNYYKQGKALIVMASDSPANAAYSKQEMMVFPIKYVSAQKIADFLNKNVFGMKKVGLSSVEAATVNSAANELIVFGMPSDAEIVKKVVEQFDKEPFTKTFAVNHTTPAEMANMICNLLLPSRGISSGGKSAGTTGGMTGGAAAVSKGGSDLKLGEGIVACSISSSAASQAVAPFDLQNLSIAYFPQRGTITLMGGSEAQANMIENFIKTNDIKQPQAFLEVSIVELNEQGSKEFQNQWTFESKSFGFNFNGTSSNASRMAGSGNKYVERTRYMWENKTGEPYESKTDEGTVWKVPNQIAQTYHAVMPSSTNISWQMSYLIENRKARVLANPKIMITNGQESVIDLTQDYVEKVTSEYLTSTGAGYGATTGAAQKTYTIGSDLGIKVSLTPFISPEGYVTMNITPEYSTVASEVRTQSEVTGQSDLAATLLSRRDLDLKNVRIKDGETLVIGGLIQETEQKVVNKIPFFGDIPVIGTIFRSTSTTKAKNELVIMLTPKILNDGDGTVADSLL
ncbi:MAG: hypothetical protein E7Z92_04590 [Cyanobacteria bacterium SIG31]|nr:hypothetical protein [Cyanobacteria bacterium SIG31]